MERIQLSENFYLDEFTRSQIAARMGREIEVEEGSPEHRNLERLCALVLQPVREHFGSVHITSGLRPEWLNELIGGSKTSQHVYGQAADFVVAAHSPLEVCRWIEAEELHFDQLIHEFGKWTHVSVSAEARGGRFERLTAVNAGQGTEYRPGLLEV